MKDRGHHWEGEPPNPDKMFGFIYEVTNNLTGQRYFGKKKYVSVQRVKVAGKSRRKVVRKSNKWEYYTSSSKHLNADIQKYGKDSFTFTLLFNCDCAATLHMEEIKIQVEHDVLRAVDEEGEYLFYNRQIAGIRFRPPAICTPRSREKMSRKRRGKDNIRYNDSTYTFINDRTGESYTGTVYDFYTKYDLISTRIHPLVNDSKTKTYLGWRLSTTPKPRIYKEYVFERVSDGEVFKGTTDAFLQEYPEIPRRFALKLSLGKTRKSKGWRIKKDVE